MHVSDSFSWKYSGFLPHSSNCFNYPYGRDVEYISHHRVGCGFNGILVYCLNNKSFLERDYAATLCRSAANALF